jgi:hypothetical protein
VRTFCLSLAALYIHNHSGKEPNTSYSRQNIIYPKKYSMAGGWKVGVSSSRHNHVAASLPLAINVAVNREGSHTLRSINYSLSDNDDHRN